MDGRLPAGWSELPYSRSHEFTYPRSHNFATISAHQSAVIPINPSNHTCRWKLYETIVFKLLSSNEITKNYPSWIHKLEFMLWLVYNFIAIYQNLGHFPGCKSRDCILLQDALGWKFYAQLCTYTPFPCQFCPVHSASSRLRIFRVQFLTLLTPHSNCGEALFWLNDHQSVL